MFRNIFRRTPKKFLGIDIGTSCIRIVEMGRRGKNYKLENYGELDTSFVKGKPFRAFEKNTLVLSDENIAQAIKEICQEAKITTKKVNFSIPDFCSFFTSFNLPVMAKEELPQAIKYEVKPYIPLPLAEVTLDWLITEGEISKTPLKILVVVIPNEIIKKYQDIAEHSNLELRILEPEVFALARSSLKEDNKEKIMGVIDIGARSTTCSIFEKNILKSSHSFNFAGNELTDTLAKSLNIDYNKAQELKKKYGLKEGEYILDGIKGNIKETLLPLIDSTIAEIKKVFREYYKNEGKEVDKIICGGGASALPGLKDYFSAEFKKEVSIADPFKGIIYPPVLQETLKNLGPFYAIAVGLALKGLEKK